MKFFLDNNLSFRHATALQALFEHEHRIVALRDMFPPGTADPDWLHSLSKDGDWNVLSFDRSMRTEPEVAQAFASAEVKAVILRGGGWRGLTLIDIHWRMTKHFDQIARKLRDSKPRTVWAMSDKGVFTRCLG